MQRGRRVAVRVPHDAAALAQVRRATARVVGRPELLDDVGGVRAHAPRVAVVADLGIDVEVVEDSKFASQRVCVRRDLLAEQAERRVAVGAFDVAEDLVVGTVLADHIEDVLDWRRRSDAPWNRRRLGCRGGLETMFVGVRRDAERHLGRRLQRGAVGGWQHRKRAGQHRADVLRFAARQRPRDEARIRGRREAFSAHTSQSG